MQELACQEVSEFLSVLANPHRIRILCALFEGELSVGEIAQAVGLSPAHVSSHLRVLYDRGYLDRRREWKQVFYCLRDSQVKAFLSMAASLISADLSAIPFNEK